MNLPNKLTMLRIFLVPVFMVCAANRWLLAAGIVFAIFYDRRLRARGGLTFNIVRVF